MKRVVAVLLGVLGFLYLRLCYLTSRYIITDSAEAALRRTWDRGEATVFSCWHDEFLIALLNLQSPRFPKPLFITNDSFGGVFLETFCKLAANPCLVIRRGTPVEDRIEQLVTGLATHRRVAIAADYGRPWYKARPTAAQIAGRLDGYVLAIRLEPRRKLRVPMGMSGGIAYLPTPFSTYALWMDEPRRAGEANLDEMLHGLSRHCYATQQATEARAQLEAGPSA